MVAALVAALVLAVVVVGRPPFPRDALRVLFVRRPLTAPATAPSMWMRCTERSGDSFATCVSQPLGTGTCVCRLGVGMRVIK